MTAVLEALEKAIEKHRTGNFVPPAEVHERVKKLYTWQNVARRTEAVYDTIAQEPYIDLSDRLQRSDHTIQFKGQKKAKVSRHTPNRVYTK